MSKAKEEYESIIRPYNEITAVLICDAYILELEAEKAELIKALSDVLGYAGQDEFIEACCKARDILNKHKEK
jgi:hypothetical protein